MMQDFYVSAIVNNATMNRCANTMLRSCFSFFCLFPRMGLLDHVVILFLIFWGTLKRCKMVGEVTSLYRRVSEMDSVGRAGVGDNHEGSVAWEAIARTWLLPVWDAESLEGQKQHSDIFEGLQLLQAVVERRQQESRHGMRASGQDAEPCKYWDDGTASRELRSCWPDCIEKREVTAFFDRLDV